MRYIFVDFEMNPIIDKFQEERQICKQEIIEIGAVMLDEEFNEIDSFKLYVKPQYSYKISRKCRKLTGITTDMVNTKVGFRKSYRRFIEWCGKHDYQIFAWSDNDQVQIEQEMILKKIKKDHRIEYMLSNWTDFQEIFRETVGSKVVISLQKAIKACGMTFVGTPHDALDDARNTSLLYVEYQLNGLTNYVEPIKPNKVETQVESSEDLTIIKPIGDLLVVEPEGNSFIIEPEIDLLEEGMQELGNDLGMEFINFNTYDRSLT